MTAPSRLFRRPDVATVTGVLLLAGAVICFRDAYTNRGRPQPWWLGPFTPL